jgi:hypothetical protein
MTRQSSDDRQFCALQILEAANDQKYLRRATEPGTQCRPAICIYRQAVHAGHGEDAEYIGIRRNGSLSYLHR